MHSTNPTVFMPSSSAANPLSSSTLRTGLTFGSAPVAGGGVGKGTIAKVSPWTSPVPVYNPDTSYGRSFNGDHGEFFKVRMQEKRKAYDNPHSFQPTGDFKPKVDRVAASKKELNNFADGLTESLIRFPNKLAVFDPNRQISINPSSLPLPASPLPKWSTHQRISGLTQANEAWLSQQRQRNLAKQLSEGAIIPSMNHLQMYGRKEQKSK